VACVWIAISLIGALPVLLLSNVELTELDDIAARPMLEKALKQGSLESLWLATHDFEPQGVFQAKGQAGNPHFVVWRRTAERTYLCIYVFLDIRPRIETDLITIFEFGELTTGTTKDCIAVPGSTEYWGQSFSVSNVAELWKHHQESLDYLAVRMGRWPSTQDVGFREDLVHSLRGQTAAIRSVPLWFLRLPYWYFVRRFRLHGKSIREQLEDETPILLTAT
jgi:hypothetical protein